MSHKLNIDESLFYKFFFSRHNTWEPEENINKQLLDAFQDHQDRNQHRFDRNNPSLHEYLTPDSRSPCLDRLLLLYDVTFVDVYDIVFVLMVGNVRGQVAIQNAEQRKENEVFRSG